MLDTAPRVSRRRAGKGQDMQGPADLLASLAWGRQERTEILNQIEQAGTWRWQLLGTSIMLKPKPDNTDRPLGLLPVMVRMWEKFVKPPAGVVQRACWPLGPGSRKISCIPLRPDPMCHGRASCRVRHGRIPLHGRLGEVLRHDTH